MNDPNNPIVDPNATPAPTTDPTVSPAANPSVETPAQPESPTPVPTPTSQVAPLTVGGGADDENLTWSQIEPGIKWAVNQGILSVESLPDNQRRLFEENQ